MKTPSILLIAILAVVFIFAAANWGVITAPTSVSLLVTDVHAPLGLILVSITLLLTALFLIYVVYLQTSVLLDARRHARELATQRELADKAEASRFTDLRNHLDGEMQKLADKVEQSGNSLAAYIGELEDRLESGAGNRNQFT
jgi:hypothetical protein